MTWMKNRSAWALFAAVLLAGFVLATVPVYASDHDRNETITESGSKGPAFTVSSTETTPETGLGDPMTEGELAEVFGTGGLLDGLRKVVHFIIDVYDMLTNPYRIPPVLF